MEYNGVTPLLNDPSFWGQSLNNNPYLAEGNGLELNHENVDLLNSIQCPSAKENGDMEGVDQYDYTAKESISTSSSPDEHMSAGKIPKTNGIYSPVSVNDEKKPKSKKQILNEQDAMLIAKDDSELTEEELQRKRKAQNRAAQRAFRERKETKLKELESKLAQSEIERQQLLSQLNLIKQQNVTILTENEFLRTRSSSQQDVSAHHPHSTSNNVILPTNQREFIYGLAGDHELNSTTVNKVYENPENPGKKLLVIGAVWDYLQKKTQENERYEDIDIVEVMNMLKGNERCHGYGPAYPLELVDQAAEHCSRTL